MGSGHVPALHWDTRLRRQHEDLLGSNLVFCLDEAELRRPRALPQNFEVRDEVAGTHELSAKTFGGGTLLLRDRTAVLRARYFVPYLQRGGLRLGFVVAPRS